MPLVYNNFPWPESISEKHTQTVEEAARAVLDDGRKSFFSDAERVAFLFESYEKYTSFLPSQPETKKSRKKKKSA